MAIIGTSFTYTQVWNSTKSGHGKGAPDGVEATTTSSANAVVAARGDIENLEKFYKLLNRDVLLLL